MSQSDAIDLESPVPRTLNRFKNNNVYWFGVVLLWQCIDGNTFVTAMF